MTTEISGRDGSERRALNVMKLSDEKRKVMEDEMRTFLSCMESFDIEKKAEELVKYMLNNRHFVAHKRRK